MKLKHVLFVLGIIIVAVIGWRTYQNRSYPIVNTPIKDGVFMVFGDSLVFGVGSEKGGGFVPLLEQRLGRHIINAGVSGNTTKDGLARLDADVLSHEPALVFVLLGGNDFLRRFPKDETFNNLKEIITRIQKSGAVVVLLGVQGGLFSDGFEKNFKDLARETGSVYVSNILNDLLGDRAYMYDAIHPNDAGYEIIARRIEQSIQVFLK